MKDLKEYLLPTDKRLLLKDDMDEADMMFNYMYQHFKRHNRHNYFLKNADFAMELIDESPLSLGHWEDLSYMCKAKDNKEYFVQAVLEWAGLQVGSASKAELRPLDEHISDISMDEHYAELVILLEMYREEGYETIIDCETIDVYESIISNLSDIEHIDMDNGRILIKEYGYGTENYIEVSGENLDDIREIYRSQRQTFDTEINGTTYFGISEEYEGWDYFNIKDLFMDLVQAGFIEIDYNDVICKEDYYKNTIISNFFNKLLEKPEETKEVVF